MVKAGVSPPPTQGVVVFMKMDNQSRFEVSFILLLLCVRSFLFEITYLFVLIEINLALANVASRIVLSVVFKLSYALGPLVWS